MKISLPGLIFLSLALLLGQACATPAENFAKANTAYEEGRFSDAIAGYEGLVRQGENRAELFHNLGSAWQKNGNSAKAIANFERALLLDPQSAAARADLLFVQSKLAAPPQETRWWMRLPLLGADFTVAAATFAAWIFLLALVGRWRGFFGAANFWTFLAVLALFSTVLLAVSFYYREFPLAARDRAVVLQNTPVRATFSDNSRVVANPAAGSLVRVVSVNGPWTNCRLADGTQGWLASNAVEKIAPPQTRQ